MVGPDPSRFDYLFEPIDGDTEIDEHGDVGGTVAAPVRTHPIHPWSWLVVVTAIIVGVGVVGLIVLRFGPVEEVRSPPLRVTAPALPGPVATVAPVVASAPESVPPLTSVPEPTASVVPVPEPAPQPLPTAVAPSTSAGSTVRPSTPTVRTPMSVSPEPRPAFPNQKVPDGNQSRGGLLGRGGLL